MGVNHFVLQAKTTKMTIGDVDYEVGTLRDIGKHDQHTKSEKVSSVARVARKVSPKAVLAFGYGSDREGDAKVIAWEAGMSATNDYDWSCLPVLGVAKANSEGHLSLYSDGHAELPMTQQEAIASGVIDQDGNLFARGRPRVAEAFVSTVVAWTHPNLSSSGPVEVLKDQVVLRFVEFGAKKDLQLPLVEKMSEVARSAISAGTLGGMTFEEAWAWVSERSGREFLAEMEAVIVIGGGRLDFCAGSSEAWMFPERDTQGVGLRVSGGSGGAGYPQHAETAFADIGDRLARSGDIKSSADGFVALQAGMTTGIVVVGNENGSVTVACGGPLPREITREMIVRGDTDVGNRDGVSAHIEWEHQKENVPASKVGPFLADFALYLAECGGAALKGDKVPTFRHYLDHNGIDYGVANEQVVSPKM